MNKAVEKVMMKRTQGQKIDRVEAIRLALLDRKTPGHETLTLYVCHLSPFCNEGDNQHPPACRWCHQVPPDDTRSAPEIERDMLIQQRGH